MAAANTKLSTLFASANANAYNSAPCTSTKTPAVTTDATRATFRELFNDIEPKQVINDETEEMSDYASNIIVENLKGRTSLNEKEKRICATLLQIMIKEERQKNKRSKVISLNLTGAKTNRFFRAACIPTQNNVGKSL